MAGLASALRDGAFDAATATGLEEATFYVPADAPLPVRLFVVIAVRNSLLERYHADPFNQPNDRKLCAVTSGAVRVVQDLGLESFVAEAPPDSYWTQLAARFPASWRALAIWARLVNGGGVSYPPEGIGELVQLPDTRSQSPSGGYVVANGIDPGIDVRLAAALNALRAGTLVYLFVPSFKHLSRNSEKFLSILEYVLATNGSLLTLNALISNGYVARRRTLIRPAHSGEWREQIYRDDGLEPAHVKALRSIR